MKKPGLFVAFACGIGLAVFVLANPFEWSWLRPVGQSVLGGAGQEMAMKDSHFHAAATCPRGNGSPKDELFRLGCRCRGLAVVAEEASGGDGSLRLSCVVAGRRTSGVAWRRRGEGSGEIGG